MKALFPRAAALGLLAMVLTAGILGIVRPVAKWLAVQHQDHAKLFSRIARASAHATEHDTVAAALKELDAREFWKGLYANQSPDAATANLQAELQTALTGLVLVTAVEPLKVGSKGPLVEIGTHVAFTAQADKLAETLGRLSSSPHLFHVLELAVSSPGVQRPDANQVLGVDLVVSGYLLPAEGGSP